MLTGRMRGSLVPEETSVQTHINGRRGEKSLRGPIPLLCGEDLFSSIYGALELILVHCSLRMLQTEASISYR